MMIAEAQIITQLFLQQISKYIKRNKTFSFAGHQLFWIVVITSEFKIIIYHL